MLKLSGVLGVPAPYPKISPLTRMGLHDGAAAAAHLLLMAAPWLGPGGLADPCRHPVSTNCSRSGSFARWPLPRPHPLSYLIHFKQRTA